ncbi:hypothetical protein [Nitratidesulfovibrio sp. SRB-5]|uniref:hypothetical protein n=1 Tax=Nitratidesulfovibrio sp. SRB-5 TaxID=2872636 RepID=UPI0010270D62|nr:hypothetical protein [Nitratidesulfovibrio sp. SRB-5]MBZ2171440.1 hypothetical protein [Nitratidesulfovibrio sp. SRB-5]RXF78352.1 hypothetical protein EKK70_01645 [Desulfovibrio sp. DS-1]
MQRNKKLIPALLLAVLFSWALYNLLSVSGLLPGTGQVMEQGDDGAALLPAELVAEVTSLNTADETASDNEWMAMVTQAASGRYYKDARDQSLTLAASRALEAGKFAVAITAAEVMYHPEPREDVLQAVVREAAKTRATIKYSVRAARNLSKLEQRRAAYAHIVTAWAELARGGQPRIADGADPETGNAPAVPAAPGAAELTIGPAGVGQ